MAVQAGFNTKELEQLGRDLAEVSDRYPDKAKKFLQKEGTKQRKLLKAETTSVTTKRSGNLLKGIKKGSVHEFRGDWQVRVSNKAPHAHLIEHGHIQWAPVGGWKSGYRRKTEQYVPGRHPAAHATNKMKDEMYRDAQPFVDELLRGSDL